LNLAEVHEDIRLGRGAKSTMVSSRARFPRSSYSLCEAEPDERGGP
jgi:hypothetical protein